jgi:hypothetical protein
MRPLAPLTPCFLVEPWVLGEGLIEKEKNLEKNSVLIKKRRNSALGPEMHLGS